MIITKNEQRITNETKYGTETQLEQFSSPGILSPLGGRDSGSHFVWR
jgi:hypothetical protein